LFLEIVFAALFALFVAGLNFFRVSKYSPGNEKMQEIASLIHEGAMVFLKKQYSVVIWFVLMVAVVLAFLIGVNMALAFVLGAVLSAFAGNIGMRIATKANVRTTEAARVALGKGFSVAFDAGLVAGMSVVGLGLLGITVLFYVFNDPAIIFGFGFGASAIALFARVAGGIYTKAADIGADLVGKLETSLPEDDPRNPAVIADNVGDNVGDVAGMGADLFESYVDSIIAAIVIGFLFFGQNGAFLPLVVAAFGIIASVVGTFFVRVKKEKVFMAIDKGIFVAVALMVVFSYITAVYFMGTIGIFYAILTGLASALVIGFFTEYVTSPHHKPTRFIAEASKTGAGTNVIAGLGVGMFSTVVPVLTISAAIIISFSVAGLLGVAVAAVGMLSIIALTLGADVYGSISDNAQGIAEMAGLGKEVRERTEMLDAVGNSTAAVGKGFAISSAALTTLALFASYIGLTGLSIIDLSSPTVIAGLFLGAMTAFFFSALTMRAVGSAASQMVEEVRRQFKQIKGLLEGKAKPNYNKCIEISTDAAIKKMAFPAAVAILFPLAMGLGLGPEALGGFLAGAIASGFLLAVFMANAGASWDNAKKFIEAGNFGGKGSPAHKAAIVGDTVGDPFKDTSGPALNILIKLMTIVSLVFIPLLI